MLSWKMACELMKMMPLNELKNKIEKLETEDPAKW